MGEVLVLHRPPTEPKDSASAGPDGTPRDAAIPEGPMPAPSERVVWGCGQIVHVLREVWPHCVDQWGPDDRQRIGNGVLKIEAAARELARLLTG